MMKVMGEWIPDLCPCYIEEAKNTLHILQCTHPGMVDTYAEDIQELKISL